MILWGENGILNWWKLRSVGSVTVLKVSYVALAATPFLAKFRQIGDFLHLYDNPVVLSMFFGSIFLATANLFYDIFCPILVKKFENPNTFFKEMLKIKRLEIRVYPDGKFNASLDHCKEAYIHSAISQRTTGLICGACFGIAALFFAFVLADRIWVVLAEFL